MPSKTSITLDPLILDRLKACKAATGISKSRLIRAILALFPWWKTDRVNVVLSIPQDVVGNPEALSRWLDEAKQEVIEKLADR